MTEIFDSLRSPMRIQVLGRRTDDPPTRRDTPRHQARIPQVADAHDDIQALLDDVHEAVRELDLQLEFGLRSHERRERASEVRTTEVHWGAHPQHPSRLGLQVRDRRLCLGDLPDDRFDALAEHAAAVRESDAAGRPVEEAYAQPLLQGFDVLADRRGGDAQPSGSRGEAPRLGHPQEALVLVESIHCALHPSDGCIVSYLELVSFNFGGFSTRWMCRIIWGVDDRWRVGRSSRMEGSRVMIELRKAADRGHTQMDWLESRHSFSFAHYHDPENMGHGPLRVINEDWIAAQSGFPSHPHRDMEILTYMLAGTLTHHDSEGNTVEIKPGRIQLMHAGSGIVHSELNFDPEVLLHQILME